MGRRKPYFLPQMVCDAAHPDIAADSVDARNHHLHYLSKLVAVLALSVLPVWITQPQAAEILGVHPQTVAKMVARGDLNSRGRTGRASLARDQVLKLRAEREERSRAPKNPPRQGTGWSEPPDAEHDWLTSVQAAELLGVSTVTVHKRCRGGRLPFVEKVGAAMVPP
jgi:hypothetical protein